MPGVEVATNDITKLPLFNYRAIYADPAWNFQTYSEKGAGKSPSRHYKCMSLAEIKALPVGHLASRHCVLFLWVTDPMVEEGIKVMAAWGFKYKTIAFTWVKQAPVNHEKWHMGTGYWTRANPEMCLLGVVGEPERLDRGVRQLVISPVRQHSRKPEEIIPAIERLVKGPYVELFARHPRPGWSCWGDELDKFTDG